MVVLLAWALRAVRMIGTPDYEHLKFNLWLEADLKARGMKVVNVTKRDRETVGQLEDLQEAAR
jgi:hypothetical protein